MNHHEECNGVHYIFRPWITKNGVKIYASSYGKKAFKIPIKNK